MPDSVSVTLAELAGSLRKGLSALAVGTGFQVMDAIIDESVNALAGRKGRHDPNRTAMRHGSCWAAWRLTLRTSPICAQLAPAARASWTASATWR